MRLVVSVALLSALALASDKPKRSVKYAPSWEQAAEEARALNVPIVVHRHGFY